MKYVSESYYVEATIGPAVKLFAAIKAYGVPELMSSSPRHSSVSSVPCHGIPGKQWREEA